MVGFVMEKQVFRPSVGKWLSRVAGPLLFAWAFLACILYLYPLGPIVLGVLVLISTLVLMLDGLPRARGRLEVDSLGLRGRLEGASFDIPWHGVLALELVTHDTKRQYLLLGLADHGVWLPLTYLDTNAVMRAVMEVAPREALELDAFDRLTWVRHLQHQHARLLKGAYGPVRIRMRRYQLVIGAFGLVFCLVLFLWFNEEGLALRLLFLGFALGPVYLLYYGFAIIEVLPEGVRLIMPYWPTFAMRWDEVEQVETDYGNSQIVLHGLGKHMVLPGIETWRRADRSLGSQAFFGHLERVNVPVQKSAAADYKSPKGTRAPRS